MGTVFVHQTPFSLHLSKFWTTLVESSYRDPQSVVVIVSQREQKQVVASFLNTDNRVLPRIISLDECVYELTMHSPISSSGVMRLLMEAVLREFGLSDSERSSGFCDCLLSVYETLNNYKISLDAYLKNHPSHMKERGERTVFLLKKFQKKVAVCVPSNKGSVYGKFRSDNRSILHFFSGKTVFVYGFLDIAPLYREALEVIFQAAESSIFLLPYDSEKQCFLATHATKQWLEALPGSDVFFIPNQKTAYLCKTPVCVSPSVDLQFRDTMSHLSLSAGVANTLLVPLTHEAILQSYAVDFNQNIQHHHSYIRSPFFSFLESVLRVISDGVSASSMSAMLRSPFAHTWHYDGQEYTLSALPIDVCAARLTATSSGQFLEQLRSFSSVLEALEVPILIPSFLGGLGRMFEVFDALDGATNAKEWGTHFRHLIDGFVKDVSLLTDDTVIDVYEFREQLDTFIGLFSKDESLFRYGRDVGFLALRFFSLISAPSADDSTTMLSTVSLNASVWFCDRSKIVFSCIEGACPSGYQENPLFPESLQKKCGFSLGKNHHQNQWFSFCQAMMDERTTLCLPEKEGATPLYKTYFFTLFESEFGVQLEFLPMEKGRSLSESESQSRTPLVEIKTSNTSSCTLRSYTDKFKNHVFSSTQLDAYQACPFRYFLRYHIGVSPHQRIQLDVEAYEWGAVVHTIFHTYNVSRIKASLPPSTTLLKESAEKLFNAHKQHSLSWDIKVESLMGNDGKEGILAQAIEDDTNDAFRSSPFLSEYAFEVSTPLRIKGAIDAVFKINEGKDMFVLDYKTGKKIPGKSEIQYFRNLQLSIYMMVAKEKFPEYQLRGGAFFQLHPNAPVGKKFVAVDEFSKKSIFDLKRKKPYVFDEFFFSSLKAHLRMLHAHITAGLVSANHEFDHMPKRSQMCRSCEYGGVCRYSGRFDR